MSFQTMVPPGMEEPQLQQQFQHQNNGSSNKHSASATSINNMNGSGPSGTGSGFNDLNFLDGSNDILDEFLDQRVYEATDLGSNAMKMDLSDAFMKDNAFELKLESEPNYNIDSFYQPSPDYVDQLAFHSPEGVSPQNSGQSQQLQQPLGQVQHEQQQQQIFTGNFNNATPEAFEAAAIKAENSPEGSNNLTPYDYARSELAKLKFGFPNSPPPVSDVDCPTEYLDFSQKAMDSLPCKLELSNLPNCSRVETQIKIKLSISPPLPSYLLHIPQDLISKSKFCLKDSIHTLPEELKKNILFLDTFVLTSDLKKSCTICPRCIKREQKRASRRKSGVYGENNQINQEEESNSPKSGANSGLAWNDENMSKKAIIYNCKEIVSFPPPTGLDNELSKSLELLVRIVCYCRHHKESKGFKLLFVVKNYKGEIVAKNITTPIMIMDRKKTTSGKGGVLGENSLVNSVASSSTNLVGDAANASAVVSGAAGGSHVNSKGSHLDLHALSPNSVDGESNSDPTNTDTNNEERGLKRKKLSVDDSFNTSSNPMFNGSSNNFSPISNSDTNTNTSTHNFYTKQPSISNIHGNNLHVHNTNSINSNILGFPPPQSLQNLQVPTIQRIIPAQGPIRGGIEVTLLGFNFRPGLIVKFGSNQALATHCWSETTIVTYLPPATQPGQVLVSFENENIVGNIQQQQVFTYTDDTDRQLIELALQIVGLKMNGKLEDAKNIAKRIVGTDDRGASGASVTSVNTGNTSGGATQHGAVYEWFDNAHKAVEILTKSDLSTEDILINFLSLVDLPNCPIVLLNWQLCAKEGQTLLHLATLKNYSNLIRFLITHGCKIDVKDNQGLTPLFFAAMGGNRELISIFLECKSNHNLKLSNDKHLIDYCDPNVLDIFKDVSDDNEDFAKNLEAGEYIDEKALSKSRSLDSLNSMFAMSFGRSISKMVIEESHEKEYASLSSSERHLYNRELKPKSKEATSSDGYGYNDESNDSSEFADSEFESNDEAHYDVEDHDEDFITRPLNIKRQVAGEPNTPATSDGEDINQDSFWQRVKNVFNNEEDIELPSYDDLFPFGGQGAAASSEKILEISTQGTSGSQTNNYKGSSSDALTRNETVTSGEEDCGITSDSSEDMMIPYDLQAKRKAVKNDKMLLFFWFPVLITIIGLFFSITVFGTKYTFIDSWKVHVRTLLGNALVGNDRIVRVFQAQQSVVGNLLQT